MKGFDKIHAKSAVKSRNSIPLDRSHLTTMDFGQINVLMNEETVPGDKFDVNASYFSRMAPLVKPTYGKFSFNTATFFVPYYQVADDAEAFFAGKTQFNGSSVIQRYITIYDLAVFFASPSVANDVTSGVVGGTVTVWDFALVDSTGTQKYYSFTILGKYWSQVLNQLGYAVPQGVDLQVSSSWYANLRLFKLSAYPILAYFKAYNDWMSNSAYYNLSPLTRVLSCIRHNVADTGSGYTTNGHITSQVLVYLFGYLKLTYETDYFTSAWSKPIDVTGSGNTESIINSAVPSSSSSAYNANLVSRTSTGSDNILTTSNGSNAIVTLGQRALDFLKDFDDWVRRNNYSGSRDVQALYSRFGIKTEDYHSNYAHLINTTSDQVSVGDVTQMAPASGSVLGDFAGKGISSVNNSVYFESSDYGLFMILGYFTVKPMYAYGFDRKVLRNNCLDYYNPEFDGIGAEAIPLMEIFENGTQVKSSDASSSDSVFGFTERYNSYRFGRDQITGEFRNFFNGSVMNVWHTGRLLNSIRANNLLAAQTDSMVYFSPNSSEYNRIFSVISGINHFYLTCQFKVDAVRPMLNLNQVPRLGDGDTTIDRNGTHIS